MNILCEDFNVSEGAKNLFALVFSFTKDGRHKFNATQKYIAEMIYCSPSSVKRYTKEQEELILKNAYKKGVKLSYQEMADMFGRTVEGIRKKELDLKRKHLHSKRANNDTWTEKEEEIIKEHLQKEDFNVTTLVRILKRDVRVVEAKTLDLSIELKNGKEFAKGGRTWTKEEEEYLKKNYVLKNCVKVQKMKNNHYVQCMKVAILQYMQL